VIALAATAGLGVALQASAAPGDPEPRTTLAQAGAEPHGIGAGSMPHDHDHDPAEAVAKAQGTERAAVAAPRKNTEKRLDGCSVFYGKPGQCLPEQPPHATHGGSKRWTCTDVRMLFPQGVTVARADRFQLDTNKTGSPAVRGTSPPRGGPGPVIISDHRAPVACSQQRSIRPLADP
jgi:hypothetical protein